MATSSTQDMDWEELYDTNNLPEVNDWSPSVVTKYHTSAVFLQVFIATIGSIEPDIVKIIKSFVTMRKAYIGKKYTNGEVSLRIIVDNYCITCDSIDPKEMQRLGVDTFIGKASTLQMVPDIYKKIDVQKRFCDIVGIERRVPIQLILNHLRFFEEECHSVKAIYEATEKDFEPRDGVLDRFEVPRGMSKTKYYWEKTMNFFMENQWMNNFVFSGRVSFYRVHSRKKIWKIVQAQISDIGFYTEQDAIFMGLN